MPTIWRGVDLNSIWHFSEGFRGGAGEQWQDAFRPTDGFSAVEHVHTDCRAVRWRSAGADAVLRRALSGHGVRPAYLPGEPARHRNLLVGARGARSPRDNEIMSPPLYRRASD